MPILFFRICVVKIIRLTLLGGPFRKSVAAHIFPYGLSGNIQLLRLKRDDNRMTNNRKICNS